MTGTSSLTQMGHATVAKPQKVSPLATVKANMLDKCRWHGAAVVARSHGVICLHSVWEVLIGRKLGLMWQQFVVGV